MSKLLMKITDARGSPLDIVSFYGGISDGVCIQLTQDTGYVQLRLQDLRQLYGIAMSDIESKPTDAEREAQCNGHYSRLATGRDL